LNHISINNQQISWAFVQKVRTDLGGDWERTIDAFWKARKATGKYGVVAYIKGGFRPDKKGNRYNMLPSKERDRGLNSQEWNGVMLWWRELIQVQERAPGSAGNELRKFFLDLANGK
jgi:hypothetical protein